MDLIQLRNLQAMNRYKRRQFVDHLYFYVFTVLTCSVICCITFCLPYLSSLLNVFFFQLIPGFASVLLSSKFLFIISNLIILALIVDSRIFSSHYSSSSSTTHVHFCDGYVNISQTQRPQIPTAQIKRSKKLQKNVAENANMSREESGERIVVSASDELNKRADEFIARVLRQRTLEHGLLKRDNFSLGYD